MCWRVALALILQFWQWKPLGGMVRSVQNEGGQSVLHLRCALGWALVLLATAVIHHFVLFWVRHPLYVYIGSSAAFWSTSVLTVTHL